METKICKTCEGHYQYNAKTRLSICHECHLKNVEKSDRQKT
jgi:uncharacterized Zn ribbon protein